MSTLRNTVSGQRRNHRERAQPLERQKWGLLEKHKDYKLRAADHRVKKRKINALQHKARERNEDEFYFGMMSAESRGGIKVAKRGEENSGGGKVLKPEVVKLMKTQDVGYLRTVLQRTKKEAERAAEEAVIAGVGVDVRLLNHKSNPRKTKFVDEEDAGFASDDYGERSEIEAGSDEEVGGMRKPKTMEEGPEEDPKQTALRKKRRKVQILQERTKDLEAALEEVEKQRAKMNGSIGGINKQGKKFKARERKG